MKAALPIILLVAAGIVSCEPAVRDAGLVGIGPCDETDAPVCWPRFPAPGDSRILPSLAVFLSVGSINQNSTLARLGYPDRRLFRIHEDLPRLRLVLLGTPASRYSGSRHVGENPEAASAWRKLALEPRFDWVEIGNQGYTHSPPGDENPNHHEFSPEETGCNLDHEALVTLDYCRQRFRLAREAQSAAGIPAGRIVIVRYPGLQDAPAALQAASEAGFLAVLGGRHPESPGRPYWLPHPGGEILDLENIKLAGLFQQAAEGSASPTDLDLETIRQVVGEGGILNIRAELEELFREDGTGGPMYSFLVGLVRALETRYGPALWHPSVRQLALWLDLQRHGKVELSGGRDSIELRIVPPESWGEAGHDLHDAVIVIRVPEQWEDVAEVRVDGHEDASSFWVGPRRLALPFRLEDPVRIRVAVGRRS